MFWNFACNCQAVNDQHNNKVTLHFSSTNSEKSEAFIRIIIIKVQDAAKIRPYSKNNTASPASADEAENMQIRPRSGQVTSLMRRHTGRGWTLQRVTLPVISAT